MLTTTPCAAAKWICMAGLCLAGLSAATAQQLQVAEVDGVTEPTTTSTTGSRSPQRALQRALPPILPVTSWVA